MTSVFTRHARLTRDHWSAVCNDELPERMPFAEELQRELMPLVGAPCPRWLYAFSFGLGVVLTIVWSNAL